MDDEQYNIDSIKIVLEHVCKIDISICVQAINGKEALDIIIKDTVDNNLTRCSFKLILMDC